ncbi:glycosyltransferase [Clostridium hydrogenum]|uniref:glycosyltransferase n=1 Tax=Clostridium hydrogenum TaxID=2855764 RepID=UPI001F3379C9|nr:glycosyltransferase [Clostridium hydrogenum]
MEILKIIAEKIENNNIEEALDLITEHNDEFFDCAEFWNMKGIVCIKVNNFDIAKNCLKAALKIDKNYIDAMYNLAYVYEVTENYYDALKQYNEILEITRDSNLENEVKLAIVRINDAMGKFNYETIIKNTDMKSAPNGNDSIFRVRHNMVGTILEENRPLVSIFVLAYNNLEKYTKKCVECILKYTKDVDYELILVDNGSDDDTYEYFKSVIHPRKKVIKITKNIGAGYGGYEGIYNSKGEYIVGIANDIFVTSNWLSNMLKCAMSDERIGMVTPVADSISNMQAVDLNYSDFDDMQEKAKKYNISNPRLWHERLRLITIGTLYKKECIDIVGNPDYGFLHDFADDDISFRIRRAGYKTILCKDVFVCHAGKINDKGNGFALKSIEKGKKNFQDKYYGVDAWSDVANFESEMISCLNINNDFNNEINVLGIDVLCGTPLLEVKNLLRENGLFDVKLHSYTEDAKYWIDLKTISDGIVEVDRIEFINEKFDKQIFDYILIEKPINFYNDIYRTFKNIGNCLRRGGQLILKLNNSFQLSSFMNNCGYNLDIGKELKNMCNLNDFLDFTNSLGYECEKVIPQFFNLDDSFVKFIKEKLEMISGNDNEVYTSMLTESFVISLKKM